MTANSGRRPGWGESVGMAAPDEEPGMVDAGNGGSVAVPDTLEAPVLAALRRAPIPAAITTTTSAAAASARPGLTVRWLSARRATSANGGTMIGGSAER